MGLEATCACTFGELAGTVKALLEPTELILRGDFKRRIALASLSAAEVVGDALLLTAGADSIRLDLGPKQAMKWATKIATPPPTLRKKLGLGDGAKALVSGKVNDAALAEALAGVTTRRAASAAMAVAEVATNQDLAAAIHAHEALPAGSPLWIVHGKGGAAILGETAVRAHMRAAGFNDTKVSAVSAQRSATRYLRKP